MLSAPHTKIKKQKNGYYKRQIYVTVMVRHFSTKTKLPNSRKSIIMF